MTINARNYGIFVCGIQSEYIQLCKTLYSLLQDSPDEQELFKGMGKVANSLLGTGEKNVQADLTSLSNVSRTGDSQQAPGKDSIQGVSLTSTNLDKSKNNEEDTRGATLSPSKAQSENATSDCAESVAEHVGTPLEEPDGVSAISAGSSESTADNSGQDSFEQAMANAEELEEKWFLTFEQFVGALQLEPVLCQFFAEQNTIDLSGTNVDPVLNPYTRTILATSP